MLWISNAAGSKYSGSARHDTYKEFGPMFTPYRIDTELADLSILPYGDFYFSGNGPRGPVNVGIERKTLRDMLACINTGRFAGEGMQLDGMLTTYEYTYLIIEGGYRCDPASGTLQEFRGRTNGWQDLRLGARRYMHSELQRFLIMMTLTPARVWHTRTPEDTVRFIADLYQQLARKKWDDHRSVDAISALQIQEPVLLRRRTDAEENELYRRRVALQSTRIGQDKAKLAARHFVSMREMANADAAAWQEIDGIGSKSAEAIVKEITNA